MGQLVSFKIGLDVLFFQRATQCIAMTDFKLKRRIVFQFDSSFRCAKHLYLLPHQMDPLVEARLCTYCICILYFSLYLCIFVRKFAADQARPSDQLSAWWKLTYLRTRWNGGHQVRNFSQPVLREKFCFCNLSGDWRTVIFKQLQQKHSKMVAFQNPKKSYSTKDFASCPRAKAARVKKRERLHVIAHAVFQNGHNKISLVTLAISFKQ